MDDAITRKRLAALRQLLGSRTLGTQEGVVQALTQLGFEVTQSSVSRDLHKLGALKTTSGYVLPAQMEQPFRTVIAVDLAGPNLMVLRTSVGGANMVAVQIDNAGWPEVIGTVAGDDTIFVATKDAPAQQRLKELLAEGGMK